MGKREELVLEKEKNEWRKINWTQFITEEMKRSKDNELNSLRKLQ